MPDEVDRVAGRSWSHKPQPERLGLIQLRIEEVLFKEIHRQINWGQGHSAAHGVYLNLVVISCNLRRR